MGIKNLGVRGFKDEKGNEIPVFDLILTCSDGIIYCSQHTYPTEESAIEAATKIKDTLDFSDQWWEEMENQGEVIETLPCFSFN